MYLFRGGGEHNRILTKTIYGQKIFCDASDISLTPHIIFDGYWEKWITKIFLEHIHQGMHVLDIGANIGYYSLLAASKVGNKGSVTSFEANPQLADIIASNFSINGYLDFCKIKNIALYKEPTILEFNILKKHKGSSSIYITEDYAKSYHDEIERIKINADCLDNIIASGTKVDFIKMDAEGAETDIICGAQRVLSENRDLKILMEWAPELIIGASGSIDILVDKIKQHKFSIYKITTDSTLEHIPYENIKNLEQCDIILKR